MDKEYFFKGFCIANGPLMAQMKIPLSAARRIWEDGFLCGEKGKNWESDAVINSDNVILFKRKNTFYDSVIKQKEGEQE